MSHEHIEEMRKERDKWFSRVMELQDERNAAIAALKNVCGALCDSGVVVPEDEREYGNAVREIIAELEATRKRLREPCEHNVNNYFNKLTQQCFDLTQERDGMKASLDKLRYEAVESFTELNSVWIENEKLHKRLDEHCVSDATVAPCEIKMLREELASAMKALVELRDAFVEEIEEHGVDHDNAGIEQDSGPEWYHCPEDDTCECENVARINAAFKAADECIRDHLNQARATTAGKP